MAIPKACGKRFKNDIGELVKRRTKSQNPSAKTISKNAKSTAEVCRILAVEVDGNVQYVQAAMKRPKKSKEQVYAPTAQ